MRVSVFDYGAGNLHSLCKAVALTGADVRVQTDPLACLNTHLLVLPGVGSFAHAVVKLAPARAAMREAMRDGLPAIGICLGMQLLFDASDEGPGEGIGFLEGRVTRLRSARVPQIGWNTLEEATDPLVASHGLTTAYYANSYVCRAEPGDVVAWSTHDGDRFPAMVRAGRTIGVQFHPEKSSTAGIAFLGAAIEALGR